MMAGKKEVHGIEINDWNVLVKVCFPRMEEGFVASGKPGNFVHHSHYEKQTGDANKPEQLVLHIPPANLTTVEFPSDNQLFIRRPFGGGYLDIPKRKIIEKGGKVTYVKNDFIKKRFPVDAN